MRWGAARRFQRGLSLIEAAVALAVIGVVTVVVLQAADRDTRDREAVRRKSVVDRVVRAIETHALVHGRLPCPASEDGSGIEKCGVPSGNVPYATLGIPDASTGALRYRVGDPALSHAWSWHFKVLIPHKDATRRELSAKAVNLSDIATSTDRALDFCNDLGGLTVQTDFPEVTEPAQMAFEIDTSGNMLSMSRARTVVSRLALWRRLDCPRLIASAGHPHFNAAMAAAALQMGVEDWRTQLSINFGMLKWDLGQGTWFATNSLIANGKGLVKIWLGYTAWNAGLQVQLPLIAKPLAKYPALLLHSASLLGNMGRYSYHYIVAKQNMDRSQKILEDLTRLAAEIQHRANLTVSSRYFLNEQNADGTTVTVPAVDPNPYPDGGPLGGVSDDYIDALNSILSTN